MKKLAAEFFGTFALVFAGTGAIVVDDITHGVIGHVGIALTFGLIILTMIYSIGDVSGAHINPAVTIGFYLAKRFDVRDVPRYIGAQCLGAIAGSVLMRVLFPHHETLGTCKPLDTAWQAFLMEFVLTLFLMFVILNVSTGAKEKGITAGIAIGGTIALDALFGGPISGASMNPARSLGPALISGMFANLWVYLLAPILGAIAAVFICQFIRSDATGKAGSAEKSV
jgi:aquaporin NIP